MRRLLLLIITSLVATAAVASAREISVTLVTPASVQLTAWCDYGDGGCSQAAADVAQARCQSVQRNAELADQDLIERSMLPARQKFGFRFRCVR